ncbi:hypothetical protein VNO77_44727 [Canavalia gladiata]|uniref:Uncharacterized protein n=1 Tax=Canavalia gladiata TaxID=3824 RepID=A0AAN9PQK8_CANGL
MHCGKGSNIDSVSSIGDQEEGNKSGFPYAHPPCNDPCVGNVEQATAAAREGMDIANIRGFGSVDQPWKTVSSSAREKLPMAHLWLKSYGQAILLHRCHIMLFHGPGRLPWLAKLSPKGSWVLGQGVPRVGWFAPSLGPRWLPLSLH